jgi:hypothetical protein
MSMTWLSTELNKSTSASHPLSSSRRVGKGAQRRAHVTVRTLRFAHPTRLR